MINTVAVGPYLVTEDGLDTPVSYGLISLSVSNPATGSTEDGEIVGDASFRKLPSELVDGINSAYSDVAQPTLHALKLAVNDLVPVLSDQTSSGDDIIEAEIVDDESGFANALCHTLRGLELTGNITQDLIGAASCVAARALEESDVYQILKGYPEVEQVVSKYGLKAIGWLLRWGSQGIQRAGLITKEEDPEMRGVSKAIQEGVKKHSKGDKEQGQLKQLPQRLPEKREGEVVRSDSQKRDVALEVLDTGDSPVGSLEVMKIGKNVAAIASPSLNDGKLVKVTSRSDQRGNLYDDALIDGYLNGSSRDAYKCTFSSSTVPDVTVKRAQEAFERVLLLESLLGLEGRKVKGERASFVLLNLLRCIEAEDFRIVKELEEAGYAGFN